MNANHRLRLKVSEILPCCASTSRIFHLVIVSFVVAVLLSGCSSDRTSAGTASPTWPTAEPPHAETTGSASAEGTDAKAPPPPAAVSVPEKPGASPASGWQSLFDGTSLKGWKITEFGGHGEVGVEDSQLVIHLGAMLTGVNWTNEFPKSSYEVELEARKIEGGDFFCGVTFPVGDSFCSFIVGGWGGGVVGLSSIDGMDASENETTKYMSFPKERWFRLKLRVTPEKIQAWIDDEEMVDLAIAGRRIAVRSGDIHLAQPFGISTWQTTGALRNIRLRQLASPPP